MIEAKAHLSKSWNGLGLAVATAVKFLVMVTKKKKGLRIEGSTVGNSSSLGRPHLSRRAEPESPRPKKHFKRFERIFFL